MSRTPGKHFALISELCDFGEGKKVKKNTYGKYILYNSYVPLTGDMVLE